VYIIGFVFGSVYTRTEVVNVLTAYVYTLVRMRLLLLFTGDVSYLVPQQAVKMGTDRSWKFVRLGPALTSI
jgi:hypothetical protein